LEHGTTNGLDWIEGDVERLAPADPKLKIPHMGWNQLDPGPDPHPLFAGVDAGTHVYFVHSYHMRPAKRGDVLATTDYGGPVTAQFHPEKSQQAGLRIITNFLRWRR